MTISPQTSAVPQAIRRIAGMITKAKVVRQVVACVVIAVAYEVVAAKLPPKDYAHHRSVQLNHADSRLTH
jgi:hypothetical protein